MTSAWHTRAAVEERIPRQLEMALPAHLAKYDSLIDVIVDEVVREIEEGGREVETPASQPQLAGVESTADQSTTDHQRADTRTAAHFAAS
jgi:hypothetical protein